MNKKFRSYLSIGSNLENKLNNLQAAINAIDIHIGKVTKCSFVYESPSWGFKGEDFYNICIEIETTCSPEVLLKKALQIEKNLGRQQKTTENYQNRCIDIDIILFENQIIKTKELTIPHPKALVRNFVMFPLYDILRNEKFPNTNKTILECLNSCVDKSEIKRSNTSVFIPSNN